MSIQSFHGQVAIRDTAVARLVSYAETKRLQNAMVHWDGETGSLAGVLGETSDANAWTERLGLPIWMAHVLDTLGARLGSGAVAPTVAMLQALPVGGDVQALGSHFVCKLLHEAASAATLPRGLAAALDAMTVLHQQCISGEEPKPASWRKARQEAVRATDVAVPHTEDSGPPLAEADALIRGVGMTIEAAAWDPRHSPTAVSEVLRQWLTVEALKANDAFGWTPAEDAQIRALLREMHTRFIIDNPQEERSVFDFLEIEHPQAHARMKAYENHDREYGRVCAERACQLLTQLASEMS